jgi:two-component system alkaline phosphatase synthesis response regulator PhoP
MKKVLVVDDEEHILMLVELSLRPEFSVIKARDGNEALRLAEKEKPSLVLLDLMMPGINGFDVCKKLKMKKLPVWILSAKGLKDDVSKGLGCGADQYITKPFDPDELAKKVADFFGGD